MSGLTLLVVSKIADVVTTAVGLLYIPGITELNPIAESVFQSMGLIVGVVVFGFSVVFCVALAVELCVCELYRLTRSAGASVCLRLGAYGTLSVVYFYAAYRNAILIADNVSIWLLL
ncbi:DUF5658 family protein [Halobaculum sp. EA56]|uniref:DUF5658 family protein n=1 Tax=Halobaculum sp. EA56 TaxID=3421648 RepID=UPI003EB975CB